MVKNTSGFTIVELTITVAVIAILATITTLTYASVQMNARDSERSSEINIIASALEKYYQRSGEYPGCVAMTQSGAQVTSSVLVGIDPGVLIAPKSAAGTTNSIKCASLTAGSGPDTYAYVGNVSTTCSTGSACTEYTLQYRQESTGAIISLKSRHS